MKSTSKPGIRYRMQKRKDGKGLEKCYYARIKIDGRTIDCKVGTEGQDVTPARAAKKRLLWMEGKLPLPQDERRRKKTARAKEIKKQAGRMTYARLFELWLEMMGDYPQKGGHQTAWNYRLKKTFANKTPAEITPLLLMQFKKRLTKMKTVPHGAQVHLKKAIETGRPEDIEAARKNLAARQKPLSYATQAHALKFLRRLTNWAIKNRIIKHVFIDWEIKQPTKKGIDNLTREQIQELIAYCDKDFKPAAKMILLALYTGARRTEILNLKWSDIDFDLGAIRLGRSLRSGTTKGGGVQDMAPLNSHARAVLKNIPKISNKWVFPSPITGEPYVTPDKGLNTIKKAVGLPENFRILHGCRHVYATHVGTVGDAYAVKDLLHHKDLETSKIYTHLPTEHLRQISERATALYHAPAETENKVIDIKEHRKA